MKKNLTFFPLAAWFAATFLLAATTASAERVPEPVSGDLFLGFRSPGTDESYLVKIGLDSIFRTAAADSTFEVTGLGNIGADLTSKYGANWHSRDDVFWGIFGQRPSANSIVYASKERSPASEQSEPWPELTTTARNATSNAITAVLEAIGGYRQLEATANSPVGAFQSGAVATGPANYKFQVETPGTNDFGSLSEWTRIEGDFGEGVGGTALDLYRIAGTGVSWVGYFTLSEAGVLTFSNAATEPPVEEGDFLITAVEKSATDVRLTFPAAANTGYTIEYKETLTDATWQTVGTVAAADPAPAGEFTDTDATRLAKASGFYRVVKDS